MLILSDCVSFRRPHPCQLSATSYSYKFYSSLSSGRQDMARALVVDFLELVFVSGPEIGVRRKVQDYIAATCRLKDGFGVAKIGEDHLDLRFGQMSGVDTGLFKHAHIAVLPQQ